VDYVLGRGQYSDRRGFRPGEQDKQEQTDILHSLSPKCPSCLDELHEYLDGGAMRAEIDKDPTVDVTEWEETRESYQRGVDEVTDHYLVAYCSEHDDEVYLSFQETVEE